MKIPCEMSIVRIVRMVFKKEDLALFDALFAESKDQIEAQTGCQRVLILHSTANKLERTTMSWWESEDCLNEYRKSNLFGEVWPRTKSMFAEGPTAWSMVWPENGSLPT